MRLLPGTNLHDWTPHKCHTLRILSIFIVLVVVFWSFVWSVDHVGSTMTLYSS
ncbi:hypothetical protein Mapa_018541 [Marchantia paleacea]|nr:hypothetical protein Mapa_018541 [Marchantia paleacea]